MYGTYSRIEPERRADTQVIYCINISSASSSPWRFAVMILSRCQARLIWRRSIQTWRTYVAARCLTRSRFDAFFTGPLRLVRSALPRQSSVCSNQRLTGETRPCLHVTPQPHETSRQFATAIVTHSITEAATAPRSPAQAPVPSFLISAPFSLQHIS